MSAVVSHPFVQHSYELCAALAERGLLARFFTSFHMRADSPLLHMGLLRRLARRTHRGIPPGLVSSFPLREAMFRAAGRLLPESSSDRRLYSYYRSFDRTVAGRAVRLHAKVVIGYENACLETFRACRAAGMTCVLDAASVHFRAQAASLPHRSPAEFWADVDRRKAQEIALADHILVLSQFARDSYVAAGMPPQRISVVPLGVDAALFPVQDRDFGAQPFSYLFVGQLSKVKGLDLLLRAFPARELDGATLAVVGANADAAPVPRDFAACVRLTGQLPRQELLAEYARAHVAVFPSRFDGFGQVVLEAMSTGLPVIVSDHVGAKDLVTPGETGWIFRSGDVDELKRCMIEARSCGARLPGMGAKAAARAAQQTWRRYRESLAQALSAWLGDR